MPDTTIACTQLEKTLDQYSVDYGVNLVFIENCKQKRSASLKKSNRDNAAISISIGTGHFHTSNYPEGIAHLLEHTLFNSSTNTQSDSLDKHLFKVKGQANAWTQDTCMNFQLSCAFSGFEKACEILLDKLFSPLFLESEIKQEIQAIDAEFKLKQKDQTRQLLSVQKATCNPEHPFNRFSTGNQHSFSSCSISSLQLALKTLHQNMLSSSPVAICIGIPSADYNEQTLNHFKARFTLCFKGRRKLTLLGIKEAPLYLASQQARLIEIEDKRDPKQLIISFNIYGNTCIASEMVFVTLAHMLESKHKNGLYSVLAEDDYIYDLSCNHKDLDPFNREFSVYLGLTDEGCKHKNKLIKCVLDYVKYIQHSGIEAWRFREKEAQHELQNKTMQNSSLLTACIYVSQDSLNYIISNEQHQSDHVQGEIIHADYDAELAYKNYDKVLVNLSLDKCRAYFIAAKTKPTFITQHYDVAYSEHALILTANDSHYIFAKPRKNPYMSSQNYMVNQQLKENELYQLKNTNINVKFYQHTFYNRPNGECYLSINDTQMYGDEQRVFAKKLWLNCLNEFLTEQFFDVDLANMRFRVYSHHHGFSIHTGGLSERQLLLLIEITNAIKSFSPTEKSIDKHRKRLKIQSDNFAEQKPFNRLFAKLNQKYQAETIKVNADLFARGNIKTSSLLAQYNEYFNDNYVESLVIGNWPIVAIDRLYKQLSTRFSNQSNSRTQQTPKPNKKMVSVHAPTLIHFQAQDCEHQHLIWHTIPLLSEQEKQNIEKGGALAKTIKLRLSARSLLLEKLLSQFVFKILRQERNMGYLLGVGYKPIGSYPGIAMYIDSPTHSLALIHTAMCDIIRKTSAWLNEEKSEMSQIVEDLVEQVRPHELSIDQTAARAWSHFDDENPLLAYNDLVEALRAVTINELANALNKMLNRDIGQLILTQSPHTNSGIDT